MHRRTTIAILAFAFALVAGACGGPDRGTAWDVDAARPAGEPSSPSTSRPPSSADDGRGAEPDTSGDESDEAALCALVFDYGAVALEGGSVEELLDHASAVLEAAPAAGVRFGVEDHVSGAREALAVAGSVGALSGAEFIGLAETLALGRLDEPDPEAVSAAFQRECATRIAEADTDVWATAVTGCARHLEPVFAALPFEELRSEEQADRAIVAGMQTGAYPPACLAVDSIGSEVLGDEAHQAAFAAAVAEFPADLLAALQSVDDRIGTDTEPSAGPEPGPVDPSPAVTACAAFEQVLVVVARGGDLAEQARAVRVWLSVFEGSTVPVSGLIDGLDRATAALDAAGWVPAAVDPLVYMALVEAFYGQPDGAAARGETSHPGLLLASCGFEPPPHDLAHAGMNRCVLEMEDLMVAQLRNAPLAEILEILMASGVSPACDQVVAWAAPSLTVQEVRDVYSQLGPELRALLGEA